MTLNEALKLATSILENSVEYSERDAKYIISEIFKVSEIDFIIHGNKILDNDKLHQFHSSLKERQRDIPLEYIFNKAYFMGREFYVDGNVLIPRQDTERSVEIIKQLIEQFNYKSMLEIGVGSGCVSITIAIDTGISIDGVDISKDALSIANQNKEIYNCSNLHFILSDIFENIQGMYDLIYSNPPYIPTNEMNQLMRSVREYEPHLALDGGEHGLYFYDKIIRQGKRFLKKDGFLIFEIGYNQKNQVKELLKKNGYIDIQIQEDYSHLPRVIWARNKG